MEFHFETSGLTSAEIDNFQQTFTILKDTFNIEATGYIDFQLNSFEAFKQYTDFNIRDSYLIKNAEDNCYILFAETQTKNVSSKGVVTELCEYQIWALAYLKCDLGKVMIRPETLRDKIVELIFPIELDFEEDKAFSDTFYVVVNDRHKAVAGITRNLRNAVMDIREDDFVIEVSGHTLIIGSRKPLSPQRAVHLAEFVTRLVEICN